MHRTVDCSKHELGGSNNGVRGVLVLGIETLGVCQGGCGIVSQEILDASSLHIQSKNQHQTCQSIVGVLYKYHFICLI